MKYIKLFESANPADYFKELLKEEIGRKINLHPLVEVQL